MRSLDLFSGIGGITLALRDVVQRPVGYCEIDDDCIDVLRENMKKGNLPWAPIHLDIKQVRLWEGDFDILVGGFPCQDISRAGKQLGIEGGARSGLFYEVVRILKECKPPYVFLENVAGLANSRDAFVVAKELGAAGYGCLWTILGAHNVGAPHKRMRWFLLGIRDESIAGMYMRAPEQRTKKRGRPEPWNPEAFVKDRRMVPKSRDDLSRNAMLGNSVVPQQVRMAFHILTGGTDDPKQALPFFKRVLEGKADAVRWRNLESDHGFVIDPKAYKGPPRQQLDHMTPELEQAEDRALLPTPRHGTQHPCNVLSVRSQRDLPTFVRYERDTPDDQRKCTLVDPVFAEWVMGYPTNWTKMSPV